MLYHAAALITAGFRTWVQRCENRAASLCYHSHSQPSIIPYRCPHRSKSTRTCAAIHRTEAIHTIRPPDIPSSRNILGALHRPI